MKQIYKRYCEWCEWFFTTEYRRQRFCSPSCNQAAYKWRKRNGITIRKPSLPAHH